MNLLHALSFRNVPAFLCLLCSAFFGSHALVAQSPAGWTAADIGNTIVAGRTEETAGVFSVTGAGAGVGAVNLDHESSGRGDISYHIPGASDEMQFCSRPWTGDGE